jgi:hypothetical protein
MCTQVFNVGDVQAMVEAAVIGAEAGYNVFIEARAVKPGRPIERGKANATTGVFAFVIDHDADKNRAGHINGNASAVVETSPGNHHEWIFLDRALNADAAKSIGDMIRKASGGDACSGVITQPFRLPGTPNFPDAKKIARGRIVVPTHLISITDKVWTPDELTAAFGQITTKKSRAAKIQPRRKAAGALNRALPTNDPANTLSSS